MAAVRRAGGRARAFAFFRFVLGRECGWMDGWMDHSLLTVGMVVEPTQLAELGFAIKDISTDLATSGCPCLNAPSNARASSHCPSLRWFVMDCFCFQRKKRKAGEGRVVKRMTMKMWTAKHDERTGRCGQASAWHAGTLQPHASTALGKTNTAPWSASTTLPRGYLAITSPPDQYS